MKPGSSCDWHRGSDEAFQLPQGMSDHFCALDHGHILSGFRRDYGAGLPDGHRMTLM